MSATEDSNLSDEQLVKEIINNDQGAFKELYCKYSPLLFRFALFRLHNLEQSQDLIQEVFSRIWIKRSNLDPNKSIKAYLYKALNNSIINLSQLASSKNRSIENLKINKTIDPETEIDNVMDVRGAIQKLPEKLKIVFALSRVEGYKYTEIAEICEISVKAVEKRMSKAFKLLKKILE